MLHWSEHLPVLVYAHNSDKAVAAALPGWPRSLCLQVTGIHPPTHFLVSQCLLQAAKNIFPFHRQEHNLWHKVLGLLLSCPEPSFSCSSPFSHTLSANLRFPANLWMGKGEITAPLSQGLSSCWLERCKNLDPVYVQGDREVMEDSFSSPSHIPGSCPKQWPYKPRKLGGMGRCAVS